MIISSTDCLDEDDDAREENYLLFFMYLVLFQNMRESCLPLSKTMK